MNEFPPFAEYLVWLISALLVVTSVSIHFEVMTFISDRIIPWAQKKMPNRRVMAITITCLMIGHVIEIWLFALAMLLMTHHPALGQITGDFNGHWGDFIYLSGVDYTSLGENNVLLRGPIRAVAVSETLTGMLMIAWSASFAYLKMEQLWKHRDERQ